MQILSPKLGINGTMLAYWCPGCNELHQACAERWHWNKDAERPTLSPSVRHFYVDPDNGRQVTLCHYFVEQGQIRFCSDCPHDLKGRTVPLPDLPEIWHRPVPG